MATMKKLGFLNSATAEALADPVEAFHGGLKQVGFIKDKNVEVTEQWAKHDLGRLPELARKLVEAGVDVLAATGGLASAEAAVTAAKSGAKTIRIVFVGGFDPVKANLVDNLEKPTGNVTGVTTSTTESLPDRLGLAKEMLRNADIQTVAVLIKPNTLLAQVEKANAGGALILEASTEDELKTAFAKAKKARQAILVGADAFFTSKRAHIVALAQEYGVPTIYPFREYAYAGGLMSYGPSLPNAYRQAGVYVGQILDDPTCPNPPVLRPTSFEHVLNLKAANALGLEIPHGLLARATRVIF